MTDHVSQRRAPILIFIATIAVSFLLHWGTGRLQVRWEPDSDSYLGMDWSSIDGVFRGIRTPGYPLFLAMTSGAFGPDCVPVAHWLASVAAVGVWYLGLRRIGYRTLSAYAASAPLLFSMGTWDLGPSIASDSLGISLCVASCGWFLMALAEPRRWWPWIALGAGTLAAILVRPAYLFLAPMWPMLAAWMTIFVRKSPREAWMPTIVRTVVVSFGPLVAYCALRAVLVGHFGLVSFAGYNLIGVTGQFLTEEDLPLLKDRERAVAQQMLKNRETVVDYAPPTSYETMVRLYNATAWATAAPAARRVLGDDVEAGNAALQAIGLRAMALHPRSYVHWLLHNGKSMLDQLLRGALADLGSRLAILGLLAVLLAHALAPQGLARRWSLLPTAPSPDATAPSLEWRMLAWLCLVILCSKGLLVILVEPALGRYVVAVGCLIPALVGWICGHLAKIICESAERSHP